MPMEPCRVNLIRETGAKAGIRWRLTKTAWERLRSDLKKEFELLRENLQKQNDLSGDYLTGVMALIPHAAYHLGTIRQQIERVRMDTK